MNQIIGVNNSGINQILYVSLTGLQNWMKKCLAPGIEHGMAGILFKHSILNWDSQYTHFYNFASKLSQPQKHD